MNRSGLFVTTYEKQFEEEWDQFVRTGSVNGTFLQTKHFLNYHPNGRFIDASYIVRDDKGEVIAVCPACLCTNDGKKTLFSHTGSTYGGIIVHRTWYKTHKVIDLLESLENRWRDDGIERVILKQTPNLLAEESQDLMEYCYYYLGYSAYKELNLYVDFAGYNEDILNELTRRKRRNVYACERAGCAYKRVVSRNEVALFHELLSLTLEKYNKKPVHTPDELYDFITGRLKDECEIFGIYKEGKMIAGAMMFYFLNTKVAHTQYLCANPTYNKMSPMTYTYYAMLCEMRKRGFHKVSWGIVTEDMGTYLNDGLVDSKEEFGSQHGVNITYQKEL